MDCPNIDEMKFSQASIDAIEEIRRLKIVFNDLLYATPAAHIANIFVGNSALEATFSLGFTDFQAMANALKGLPLMEKNRLLRDVKMVQLSSGLSYQERQFWKAIESGCELH